MFGEAGVCSLRRHLLEDAFDQAASRMPSSQPAPWARCQGQMRASSSRSRFTGRASRSGQGRRRRVSRRRPNWSGRHSGGTYGVEQPTNQTSSKTSRQNRTTSASSYRHHRRRRGRRAPRQRTHPPDLAGRRRSPHRRPGGSVLHRLPLRLRLRRRSGPPPPPPQLTRRPGSPRSSWRVLPGLGCRAWGFTRRTAGSFLRRR
jgi:hypothetical protein